MNSSNTENSKLHWFLLVLGFIGVVVFILFYNNLFPWATIKFQADRNSVIVNATSLVRAFDVDLTGFRQKLSFNQHEDALHFIEKKYGQRHANKILTDSLTLYYWRVTWRSPRKTGSEKTDENGENIDSLAATRWIKELFVDLNLAGEVIGFSCPFDEKAPGARLDRESALSIADSVKRSRSGHLLSNFVLDRTTQHIRDSRNDYHFSYKQQENAHGLSVYLNIHVYGDRVGQFLINYKTPEESESSIEEKVSAVLFIIAFLGLFVGYIYFLIIKLRADQINFKFGLPFGIIGALCIAITLFSQMGYDNLLEFLIPLLIAPVFVGLSLLVATSVSEVMTREIWNEKLLTIDTMFRGRVLHQKFGLSVVRGLAIGCILLGVSCLLVIILDLSGNIALQYQSEQLNTLALSFPFPVIFSMSIHKILWLQVVFILFLSSLFAKWLRYRNWIIITVAFVWALMFAVPDIYKIEPLWARFISGVVFSALLMFFYFRYDFLTTLVGHFTFSAIFLGYPLLFYGQNFYFVNGIAFFAIIGILAVFGIVALHRYIDPEELQTYVPSLVKQLREQERLKRELEVARKVQLSFLPGKIPKIANLDIATICIPAMEVGGDYYDFVNLGSNKLGIVIGDVSGKGISAAFYMTLTKGFLKSQAKHIESPKEILSRINELFYENVERGHFISMIYGVFDMNQRKFTFARAGHNPLIIRRGLADRSEVLCPRGIALGLESGSLFEKMIQEISIDLHFKDIFVFYTDGFSEAMNKDNQEFGEDRLLQLVQKSGDVAAEDLMQFMNEKIANFVGKKRQHDDMTMVIVKVN